MKPMQRLHAPVTDAATSLTAPRPGTLDHEYNTRMWATGFDETLARHKRLGEAARAMPGALLAIPWGGRPRQRLDFFPPAGDRGALVVHIHGGYWQYRTSGKEGSSFLAPAFTSQGIAFCALQYELCPDVSMDEMVEQMREAILWIERRLPGLGYTPDRIILVGHSAGGHLAAMLALTDWERLGARRNLVAGICGVSGLYDLRPLVSTYLNTALRLDVQSAERNSPIDLLRRDAPPMLLAVGALESGEFKRQTERFSKAAGSLGISSPVFELADRDHYAAIEDVIEPGHPVREALFGLVASGTAKER